MQLHTFKARNLADALRLVRERLGPDASVLHTREIGSTLGRWLGNTEIEVTASTEIRAPSRLPQDSQPGANFPLLADEIPAPPAELHNFRRKFRDDLRHTPVESSIIENLCRRPTGNLADVPIRGPIRLQPGLRKVVALVGPTGVGKTTTIAKLAAHFHLRERRRVGLITVDTYRIAAVEQLRTYAEIMDLPLEVVATPREMRAAIGRLTDFDLLLIDTAGRSPRDAVRLQELRSVLAEAQADEIHLVQSAASGAETLAAAARAFASVGATALVLTKLDEAASLNWLPGVLHAHNLPLSYTTSGQNVPDDIKPAAKSTISALTLDS